MVSFTPPSDLPASHVRKAFTASSRTLPQESTPSESETTPEITTPPELPVVSETVPVPLEAAPLLPSEGLPAEEVEEKKLVVKKKKSRKL